MWKRVVAISLVLVMVLPVAACAGEGEEVGGVEGETEPPSAQEIVDGVIEALDMVTTYQFDWYMSIDIAGEAEGETSETTMTLGSYGVLDLWTRQMRADISMTTMRIPEEAEIAFYFEEMYMAIYVIGDMGYVMMQFPEMAPIWTKAEMSEADWEQISGQMSQTKSQVELLETAEVEVIGTEQVRGVDCYVLQLTPDMGQLWQVIKQQQEISGWGMPDIAEELIQEMLRSFSMKQWVTRDTYFLTKVEIEMTVEITPEAAGLPEEEGVSTMDISMSLLAYDHNQPVSVELPPEAEEAIDVTGGG